MRVRLAMTVGAWGLIASACLGRAEGLPATDSGLLGDSGAADLDAGPTDSGAANDAGVAGDDAGPADGGSRDAGSTGHPFDASVGDGGVPAFIVAAAAGQWSEASSNTVSDVEFDYTATPPPDGYRTSLQGVMDAWSGGVYVPAHHRLYVNGGGHRDYDGNEWYAFNLERGQWERVNDPSLYLESDAPNGVFPDGAPIPIHTYDTLTYAPETNSLYRMGRGGSNLNSVWAFSLDTGRWSNTLVPVGDPSSSSARYLPWRATILLLETNSQAAGYAAIEEVDPVLQTKTERKMYGPSIGSVCASVDPKDRVMVVFGGALPTVSVDPATGEDTKLATSGDQRLEAAAGPGCAYDSQRDRFVGWGAGSTQELFVLTKGSWAWSTLAPTGGATPSPKNGNGVFGRFAYAPEYDVFIVATNVNGPVYLYKPIDWRP